MIQVEKLLSKLGDITSNRDIYQLERSFLQVIYDEFPIKSISLIKITDNSVWETATFSNEGFVISEREIPLSGKRKELLEEIYSRSDDELICTDKDDESHFFFKVDVISTDHAIVEIHKSSEPFNPHMDALCHLIKIFNNYYNLLGYAQTDELTGLLNRKTFNAKLKNIFKGDGEENSQIIDETRTNYGDDYWLGLIDIDHFKSVNDRFGHVFGDEVLLLIAQLLQKYTRRYDSVYRFGGEEFVVLFRSDTKEHACAACERIRVGIAENKFPQVGQVTVSIGAVQILGDIGSTELLDKADQALYYAKEHGRNCFYLYEDLLDQGILQENVITSGDIELF